MVLPVRRIWIPLATFVLTVSGAAVAADALVVSRTEQLDRFLDDVSRSELGARLDGTLSHVDPDEVPLRLRHAGETVEFGAGEDAEVAEAVRAALSVFDGQEQRLLQHAERVDGERATVTTRIGDSGYEQTVIYDLVRRGDRWLVRGLRTL